MPWVRFEKSTPVSERAKTVHALDSAATWNRRGINLEVVGLSRELQNIRSDVAGIEEDE
jgi:hypothetical protein